MKNFSLKMKGSYRRSPKRSRAIKVLFVAALIFGVLYFFGALLGGLVSYATTPILSLRTYFAESNAALPEYVRSRTELIDEMNALRAELATQSGRAATIARLEAENESLRSLQSLENESRVAAGIIARPPNVPYDTLVIDRGSDDGVIEGALVYQADDHVIGSVVSSYPQSALVMLFSSPDVRSTVYVFGPDIFTTAYGEGGGIIRLSIPQGVPINVGDVVVVPGANSGTVGTVSAIESTPTLPEQRAYVTPPFPIQSLRYVSVGTRVPDPISFEDALARIHTYTQDRFVFEVPDEFLGDSLASTTAATSSDSATELADDSEDRSDVTELP